MKVISLSLIGFVFTTVSIAQHNFSVTPSVGISKIAIRANYLSPFHQSEETKTHFRESYGLNIDYQYDFEKISISSGLGLASINGKQDETYTDVIYKEDMIESITMNLAKNRSTLYITFPLLFSITNNKLKLGLGYQVMTSIFSRTQITRQMHYDTDNPTILSDYPTGKITRSIDYGAIFECGYQIMPRATIIAKAYIGLNDISFGNETRMATSFPNPPSTHQLYSRQFTIGFSYRLNKGTS